MTATTQIITLDEPTAPSVQQRPALFDARSRTRLFLILGWIIILPMIAFTARQQFRAGVDIRNAFWTYSHPVHEKGDVENAFRQGNDVLRFAENKFPIWPTPENPHPATILKPGTMLFDGPMDWPSFKKRWQTLRPVYRDIYQGWHYYYRQLETHTRDENYDLDYPPLRLAVMTIWTWHIQARYPQLRVFPYGTVQTIDQITGRRARVTEDLVQPLLHINTACEAISAIVMFLLVWIWANRGAKKTLPINLAKSTWRRRWGDPLLLAPAAALILLTLIWKIGHAHVDVAMATQYPIDFRVGSLSFWLFMLMRYISMVCLARFLPHPFRGPACGFVAGTIVWLNPALLLDAHGWPQWDCWLLPFFLIATLLVSVDWWLAAGLVLGVGCMFKGQMLFIIPLFVLWPIFAGWHWRVMRILAGVGAGMAAIVWPWNINATSEKYVFGILLATAIALLPRFIWAHAMHRSVHQVSRGVRFLHRKLRSAKAPTTDPPTADVHHAIKFKLWSKWEFSFRPYVWMGMSIMVMIVSWLVLWAKPGISSFMHGATVALLIAIILVPYVLPRRAILAWFVFTFSCAAWLGAFGLNGDFAWWRVGFMYGTRKFQVMQLGFNSLSNLSSILAERYGWRNLHESMTVIHLNPLDLTLLNVLVIIYLACLLLWAVIAKIIHRSFNTTGALALLGIPIAIFALLNWHMGGQLSDHVAFLKLSMFPTVIDLEVRDTLAWLYMITLVLCAVGAAIYSRRKDPRLLISLIAPWILFPTLLTQMTARYTVLSATLAAAMLAVSVGMSLWQLVIMIMSTCMLGHQFLQLDPPFSPLAYRLTHPTYPDLGWALVLAAAAFLYCAVIPPRVSRAGDDLE